MSKHSSIAVFCCWKKCGHIFYNIVNFQDHCMEHLMSSWGTDQSCGICETTLVDYEAAQRHVNFHVWSRRLFVLGQMAQETGKWPKCRLPNAYNEIPPFPTPFDCEWKHCDFKTNDVAKLYSHVSLHPEEYGDSRYAPNMPSQCLWDGCEHVCARSRNLVAHLRTHTQEKVIACPDCGLLFTSPGKLRDHLMRQFIYSPSKLTGNVNGVFQELQCPRCLRVCGNKSLLQAHINRHINRLKCPHCNMTLQSKFAIKRHILFRHSTVKPFQCSFCPKRFKEEFALQSHLSNCHKDMQIEDCNAPNTPDNTHSTAANLSTTLLRSRPTLSHDSRTVLGPLAAAGATNLSSASTAILSTSSPSLSTETLHTIIADVYHCHMCSFKAKTRAGLFVHRTRKHDKQLVKQGLYACHICDLRTHRGFLLSRHMIRVHNFQRPEGHFRFNYATCPDGLMRLQTTRLDSVEVARTLLGPQAVDELFEQISTTTIDYSITNLK